MWLREKGWNDRRLIFGEPKPPAIPDSVADLALDPGGDPFMDICLRTGILGNAVRGRDKAIRHMWKLVFMAEPLHGLAVLNLPYRDLAVAEVLLDESEKQSRLGRIGESEYFARLAIRITDQPFPDSEERSEALRARGRCVLANVRRQAGDWDGAEVWFRKAQVFLTMRSPLEVAYFCERLGYLREDQGRLDEALALLTRAASLYSKSCLWTKSGICLARIGLIYLKKNDPGRAMSAFTEVCSKRMAGFPLTDFFAQVDLGRAVCLAAAGLDQQAAKLLEAARKDRAGIRREDDRIELEWLDCRIAIHLGHLRTAVPRLEAICRLLFKIRPYSHVFLCSMDLLRGYAKQSREKRYILAGLEDLEGLAIREGQPWAEEPLKRLRQVVVEEDAGIEPAIVSAIAAVPAGLTEVDEGSTPGLKRTFQRACERGLAEDFPRFEWM